MVGVVAEEVYKLEKSKNSDIHIFNGFMNPNGGSEREALQLATELRKYTSVTLWATSSRADKSLLQDWQISPLSLFSVKPSGGTYIFVGSHWARKPWSFLLGRPGRVIFVHNTFHAKHINRRSLVENVRWWP